MGKRSFRRAGLQKRRKRGNHYLRSWRENKKTTVFDGLEKCKNDSFPSLSCSQDIEVFAASVYFVSHLAPAVNAAVFVPVTVGQNEEEKFPHRHSPPTLETVKLRGFELFELCLRFAMLLMGGGRESLIHENLVRIECSEYRKQNTEFRTKKQKKQI
jgi:hypothetical protein